MLRIKPSKPIRIGAQPTQSFKGLLSRCLNALVIFFETMMIEIFPDFFRTIVRRLEECIHSLCYKLRERAKQGKTSNKFLGCTIIALLLGLWK